MPLLYSTCYTNFHIVAQTVLRGIMTFHYSTFYIVRMVQFLLMPSAVRISRRNGGLVLAPPKISTPGSYQTGVLKMTQTIEIFKATTLVDRS